MGRKDLAELGKEYLGVLQYHEVLVRNKVTFKARSKNRLAADDRPMGLENKMK